MLKYLLRPFLYKQVVQKLHAILQELHTRDCCPEIYEYISTLQYLVGLGVKAKVLLQWQSKLNF